MIFEHRDFDGHERVTFVDDERAGLRAIIAIHSTSLGPAAGGCRMWDYASSADALADVLRLSRGMSLKNAAAGLPLGGGKAVIMRPRAGFDRQRLLQAFADAVESFGGDYWTAEDVGTSLGDMDVIASRTRYVAGRAGGDPSPITARGIATCMEAAAGHLWGATSLSGLTVAVQGLGNVGMGLCRLLYDEGAKLIVADVDERKIAAAAGAFDVKVVGVHDILAERCDVLAPCALGGVLNASTIPRIEARLVCGAANNQLDTLDDAQRLKERGIAYAPDFIANAGGICSVAAEILNIDDPGWVAAKVAALGRTLRDVLERSARAGETTAAIAEQMAKERIKAACTASACRRRALLPYEAG